MKKRAMRRLTRSSRYSYSILLPPKWLKGLGWKERDKLELNLEGGGIWLTKPGVKRKKSKKAKPAKWRRRVGKWRRRRRRG